MLQAAIDRVTTLLATAPDEAVMDLVAERRALREELREMRRNDAVSLPDESAGHVLRPRS